MTLSVPEMLEADRKLAAELTPSWSDDEKMLEARSAAARHNARLDAPVPGKKSGWDATVRGVRIDDEQVRHPWTVIGHGETSGEAIDDLIAKLDARPVVRSGPATCAACGQPLPNQ